MTESVGNRRILQILGSAALALGVLAVVAGSPRRGGGRADVEALARAVEHEDDHVTAIELAQWIRDRKPNLRVVDVRDSAEYADFHIPRAERIPIETLASSRFAPEETVVLYSGGGAHAAQGWVFLRLLGNQKVYFLRGGIDEWVSEVLNPRFPASPTPAERVAIDSIRAISTYFGGVPRTATGSDKTLRGAPAAAESWKSSVARVRRRGC
jgi:rhodanese-related sulfurtransferase